MAERRNGNGIERTYGEGSSGEGAPDYSPGDNEDNEGGSSGSGWRGGSVRRAGSSGPGQDPFRKGFRESSTGPGDAPFSAVQAPNRPK